MDYEKKYKEALEIARKINSGEGVAAPSDWSVCETIFPELKESEDERIRKALIDGFKRYDDGALFNGCLVREILAWLEKQGEHKQWVHIDPISEEDKLQMMFDGQKPADKVEPMFYEGDWVVYKNDICQIVKREEGCNKLVTVFGIEKELVNERNLSTARLWTINDAKDGDVLAEDSCTFIIKKLNHDSSAEIYCCLFDDGDFETSSSLMFDATSTYPATKEQRDTLFAKMKEAGYEWDADRKELCSLSELEATDTSNQGNKPTWSKKDEKLLELSLDNFTELKNRFGDGYGKVGDCMYWLKSLKNRIKRTI